MEAGRGEVRGQRGEEAVPLCGLAAGSGRCSAWGGQNLSREGRKRWREGLAPEGGLHSRGLPQGRRQGLVSGSGEATASSSLVVTCGSWRLSIGTGGEPVP